MTILRSQFINCSAIRVSSILIENEKKINSRIIRTEVEFSSMPTTIESLFYSPTFLRILLRSKLFNIYIFLALKDAFLQYGGAIFFLSGNYLLITNTVLENNNAFQVVPYFFTESNRLNLFYQY